ncbi:MAG TPA: hypothetical protein VLJ59_02490 [Mycobacteriales bacterium]|nr:hypothetical protein [Mycobacteriales bacterium]
MIAPTDAPARTAARAPWVRGPAAALLLAVALVGCFIGARLATHGGEPGAFVVAGDAFVDPAARPELAVAAGSTGYDGQFVYRLALDPLTGQATAHGITLDNPPYRHGRIGLPALGWLVDRMPGVALPVGLLLVEAAALLGCAWLGVRYAVEHGRTPALGLVVGLSPGLLIAAARDLTEPLAMFFLLAGLDLWRRHRSGSRDGRLAGAAVLFAAGALTRETVLLVLGGMGLWRLYAVLRHPGQRAEQARRALALVVPLAAVLGWQAYVRSVWGSLPAAAKGGDSFGVPLLRPLSGVLAGSDELFAFDREHLLRQLWIAERVALLMLLAAVVLTLASPGAARSEAARSRPARFGLHRFAARFGLARFAAARFAAARFGAAWSSAAPDLRLGWVLAAVVAVSVPWRADVQFVRAANEAIVVGLLVLVAARGRLATGTLALVAGWSAAVALAYAVAL